MRDTNVEVVYNFLYDRFDITCTSRRGKEFKQSVYACTFRDGEDGERLNLATKDLIDKCKQFDIEQEVIELGELIDWSD